MTTMIKGMNTEMLRSYLEARKKIDENANMISSISSMLSLVGDAGEDTINIDPFSLAYLHRIINRDIHNILEALNDFVYILDAKMAIDDVEDKR